MKKEDLEKLTLEEAYKQGQEDKEVEIIKNMLKDGELIATISKAVKRPINEIKAMATPKELEINGMKFEDNIDYRFKLVWEDAFKRGYEQGVIKRMLMANMSIQDIANVTGKAIEEIKKIADEK